MIYEKCDVNKKSYCNLGWTYKPPKGIDFDTPESKNYFAGEYNFKVKEIEVYAMSS
jgi:hypothetical protein